MDAMNVVRIAISCFILIVVALSVIGWVWTGVHQSPAQAAASRTVLTLSILAGVAGLTALWRVRHTK